MAKTFTAPFAQSPKTSTVVASAAIGAIGTDAPTGVIELVSAGSEGALLTRLVAIPRGTVTASSLCLFHSSDGGNTKRLIDSELMSGYTLAVTTAIPETGFPNVSEVTPLRLAPNAKLYVGTQVALAAGIVFRAEWTDF